MHMFSAKSTPMVDDTNRANLKMQSKNEISNTMEK